MDIFFGIKGLGIKIFVISLCLFVMIDCVSGSRSSFGRI